MVAATEVEEGPGAAVAAVVSPAAGEATWGVGWAAGGREGAEAGEARAACSVEAARAPPTNCP